MAKLLALAGADLPAEVMPADPHNPRGYFEPWRIAAFDDERLRAAGSCWDDPFAFPARPLAAGEEAAWVARGVELFHSQFASARRPLLKDPRVTVLLPFWRQVLDAAGVDVRCVITVRSPLAVAASLRRRDGFAEAKSVLLWTAYMLASEAHTRDLPRVFVSYDNLLADWRAQAARIEAAHDAALPRLTAEASRRVDAFLTPTLRHDLGAGDLHGLGWVGDLAAETAAWFERAAASERPPPAPLKRAAATLARRQAEMGPLLSPAARDHDETRAKLLDARQQLEAQRRRVVALDLELGRQRVILETGWRADVARLEAQVRDLDRQRQTLEAAWQADVGRLNGDLTDLNQQLARLTSQISAELDSALRDD